MSIVVAEIRGKVGFITLNAESSLNALSLPMIHELQDILEEWKSNENVACVFMEGAGEKAFCAGGDVRMLYQAMMDQLQKEPGKVPHDCLDFFVTEYSVDYLLHTYPKPVIVWGHGIVMGGGIGLMAGASHRIVTEKSKLAMPEITIGLYPDVGGSYFLNRMPSACGLYIAMTGARLDASDCLFLGLADHYIDHGVKEQVKRDLTHNDWNGEADEITSSIIKIYAGNPEKESAFVANADFIRAFEQVKTVNDFVSVVESYPDKNEWMQAGIKSFYAGSPSSAYIILRQLHVSKKFSLADVFRSEVNLSSQCTLHPDFGEGVRALLIDKDLAPKWTPATLADVTDSWVNSYFTPLWNDNDHPLRALA